MVSALLVVVVVKRSRSALATLAVYCAVVLLVLKFSYDLRIRCRWLISSGRYKDEVQAQPESPKAELKHTEWDGWGFAGAGYTYVYIVYDPSDSLSRIAKEKARGIRCKISRIDRLESNWYSVVFDTDTMWPSGEEHLLKTGETIACGKSPPYAVGLTTSAPDTNTPATPA